MQNLFQCPHKHVTIALTQCVCLSAGRRERPRASPHRHHTHGHRRVPRLPRHQPLHLLLLQRSAKRPQHHPQKPLPQPLHRRARVPRGHQHDRTKGTVEMILQRVLNVQTADEWAPAAVINL